MHKKRLIFSAALLLLVASAAFPISFAYAVDFGGNSGTPGIPCTCNDPELFIMSFSPFYNTVTGYVPIAILAYRPLTVDQYLKNHLGLPEWYLGSFNPDPGICSIGVPDTPLCIPIPYIGILTRTGTS